MEIRVLFFFSLLFAIGRFAFIIGNKKCTHVNFLTCSGQTEFTLSVMLIDQLRFDASQNSIYSTNDYAGTMRLQNVRSSLRDLMVWSQTAISLCLGYALVLLSTEIA